MNTDLLAELYEKDINCKEKPTPQISQCIAPAGEAVHALAGGDKGKKCVVKDIATHKAVMGQTEK